MKTHGTTMTSRSHFHVQSAAAIAFATLLSIASSGCGGGPDDADTRARGSVSGTVTIDGQPYAKGAVRLNSTATVGEVFGAELQEGGAFTLAEPIPVGSYKVTLTPPSVGPVKGEDGNMRPPTAEEMENPVPEKYRTPESSDKTVEIKEGDNPLTLDLKS